MRDPISVEEHVTIAISWLANTTCEINCGWHSGGGLPCYCGTFVEPHCMSVITWTEVSECDNKLIVQ
ncbi:UNVERIFIED_CONTAM: hypothetical protein K2H54_048141 [Gekko kuhli]